MALNLLAGLENAGIWHNFHYRANFIWDYFNGWAVIGLLIKLIKFRVIFRVMVRIRLGLVSGS